MYQNGHLLYDHSVLDMLWIPDAEKEEVKKGDVLYMCDRVYHNLPGTRWSCDRVRQYWRQPNVWMVTQDSILLHELLHYMLVTTEPNGEINIIYHGPRGYGPYNTTVYKPDPEISPRDNCGSISWWINTQFWTAYCQHTMEPPTIEAESFPATPG